ncbi:MAG: FxsA family protein [Ilumatobacteraceae bacterium]
MSLRLRWGCVALIAYPLVEIALAVAVASVIGWWWVFVFFFACLVAGLATARYALAATGQAWTAAMSSLRTPSGDALEITATAQESPGRAAPPAQASLLVPAGLLIAVPGFVTTLLGLMLALPPVRARIAQRMERAMRRGLGDQAD